MDGGGAVNIGKHKFPPFAEKFKVGVELWDWLFGEIDIWLNKEKGFEGTRNDGELFKAIKPKELPKIYCIKFKKFFNYI